jgi:preprotein translocase subunit SecA
VRKIPHSVLNAKQHEREAYVVAQAGAEGSVTVATNMAGRGTDIVLGGNPEVLVRTQMEGESEDKILSALEDRKGEFETAHQKILELGGLYVLGTERHDSRRVDNQLRGRSGRQGDPGESRFYLSLEDDLMRRFAPAWARNFMQRNGLSDGEPLEHSLITKSIGNAQKKVEEFNFEIRKNLLEYDEVMNEQRKFIYAIRNRILKEEDVKNLLDKWVKDAVQARVEQFLNNARISDDPKTVEDTFRDWVKTSFMRPLEENEALSELPDQELFERIHTIFLEIYIEKEGVLGEKVCRMMERYLLLQTIDQHWKDHLYAMDHVKDSIGWRGYAQVDPKVEYKREGFSMFGDMLYSMKLHVTDLAVRMTVTSPETDLAMESVFNEGSARHDDAGSVVHGDAPPEPMGGSAQEENRQEEVEITSPIVNKESGVGRNEPCPCGSGKKYKACCGKK